MAEKKVSELPSSNTLTNCYILGVDANGVSVKIPIGTLITNLLNQKQDKLTSGTNIKTINGSSVLGAGDIVIQGGGGGVTDYSELDGKPQINGNTLNGNKSSQELGLQDALVSGNNIKTVNNTSLLGSGNITIEGEPGRDGQDAVNPFKGWFTPSTLPTTGTTGDYCYVTSNGVSTVYKWNGTAFVDSGESVDVSGVQSFNTGEAVNATKIVNNFFEGGLHDVLSAEQGKRIADMIVDYNAINISIYTSYKFFLSADGHYASNTNAEIKLIPVLQGKTYRITTRSDIGTAYALITNDAAVTNNKTIPCCSEYPSRIVQAGATTLEYVIPSDCYYIAVMTKNTSGGDIAPTLDVLETDFVNQSELVDLHDSVSRIANINDIERTVSFGKYINTDGKWVSNTDRGYVIIPLPEGTRKIKVNTITTTNAAFLNTVNFTPVNNQPAPFVAGGARFNISTGDELEVPEDAACFYVYLPNKTAVYDIDLIIENQAEEVLYGNEVDNVEFNDSPITLWSTADSGLPASEDKSFTWPCVVKVAPNLYYMYYNTLGVNDTQGDQYFHLSFAYSTDGFTWVKEIPSGITPPISGTNKLFNTGVFGVCVVRVQDSEYPFRMLGSKWHESWSMYKSADGVNWTKIRNYNYYYDTQMSAIVRGSQIKIYMRMRNGSGRLDRYVGVMTTDLDGNLLTPPTIFFGKYLYNAAASPLDDRREILFPSFYNVDGNEMYLKCYVVDGKNIYQRNVDFSNIITSADKTMYVAPNLVNIGDDYYIYYFVTNQPHTSSSARTATMKMAKVTFNSVGWHWYPQ